jgi:carbonic anhydrase/acetyltransferase-like protein (isoleucine patch superfamily)
MPLYALDGRGPVAPHADGAWLAPGARIIGNVTFGPQVSVWFNAIVRGDNEPIRIGARTNIQDGAVLHSDDGSPLLIGADCTIGHGAIVHGCTIGDGCLVGMGATILNGARLGGGSLVGANALVTEGKTFPERSLILGAPAKAIRRLDDEEVANLLGAAARYVENARRFAAGLIRIGDGPGS